MTSMTLMDFDSDEISEKELQKQEDQKIMDLLGRFSAEMLMKALRDDGHPKPEWGDGETWRSYYLDECSRRGKRLLEQLGWSADENAQYVNLHTGDIEALNEICLPSWRDSNGQNRIGNQVWSVIEHWEPYDPSKPNQYLINYLREALEGLYKIKAKGKLALYEKYELRHIPEYEQKIKEEQKKVIHNPKETIP